jgi:ribulose 1,5-bisphosphate synthetase/thiazole synthase
MRNRKTQFAAVFFCFVLAFALAACQDDAYKAAARASDTIASSVSAGISVTSDLYAQKLITQAEKNGVATILLNITNANTEFRNQVKALHAKPAVTKADYLTAAGAFTQSVRNLLASGDLHVKDPNAQLKLDTVLKAIQTGVDGIAALITAAKGN